MQKWKMKMVSQFTAFYIDFVLKIYTNASGVLPAVKQHFIFMIFSTEHGLFVISLSIQNKQ